VESPFNLPLLFMGMALTVGCGINAIRAEAFEDSTINRRQNWRKVRLAAIGCVLVLLVGLFLFRKPILAAFYTNLGALDETRTDTTIQPNMADEIHNEYLKYAASSYERALELDPDSPNANRRLGNLYVDTGAYEEAVVLLEKAYAADPNYQANAKGLGLAYTWAGRTQDAACVFKNLSDVEAMDSELYTWQAFRHEQNQDLLSAYALEAAAILEDYQQTNLDVWMLIGDRFQAAGKPEKAQEWYSRVLQKDANHTTAKDKLKALGLEQIKAFQERACT
jgi:tetratricopeptide (TPR) repeat protein